MFPPEIQRIINEKSDLYGIPSWLISAVIMTESDGDPWAMRFEPGFLKTYVPAIPHTFGASKETERTMRATSFGLMQIMGQVAREFNCTFPFLSELCLPENGIEFGCRKLKSLRNLHFDRHGWPGVVAAYNAGSPRFVSHPPLKLPLEGGEILNFPPSQGEGQGGDGVRKFVNQAYVDKVLNTGIKFKEGPNV